MYSPYQNPKINIRSEILILNKSIFPLDYVKCHLKSLQKGSKADQYVVNNLTRSGVYLIINFVRCSS